MDTHLLTKIIHMSAVTLALLVFVIRALPLFVGAQTRQASFSSPKWVIGLQHLGYTLIILTGVILLVMKQFQVQPWFYAKIILFLVLLSTQIKAYRAGDSILLAQRRAGVTLGAVAFCAIIALVVIKPVFA
ncbi:SirB2 family protein [Acinetobacter larvae]|uniref:Invasion protein expression up-regulator SirB n=1 Tax=Acinetobacter larvae TaxID=1789224 RepID=A0A1B2LWJ6_9GAMM|nr:SirB2 family protein [Acinetobacter larvae]AOA57311.1 invasion protein expression up-regulator SirB [Acinetobacter larvae]